MFTINSGTLNCVHISFPLFSFYFSFLVPPSVLFFSGVIAPVALPAHARWSPLPVQTFPEHGECGGRRRSTRLPSCQAPLSQSQVAFDLNWTIRLLDRWEVGLPPVSRLIGRFGHSWFKIYLIDLSFFQPFFNTKRLISKKVLSTYLSGAFVWLFVEILWRFYSSYRLVHNMCDWVLWDSECL